MGFLLSMLMLGSLAYAGNLTKDIPYPFYVEQINLDNRLTPLNRGEEALQARLDLIADAKESIELEYYMFNTDIAGKMIARDLVKAAARGVKVRMLLDRYMSVGQFDAFYAKEMAAHGIEVKYYNTASMLNLRAIHYRNHRKIFVVDGKDAITGGRNIVRDEFNLDEKFNYEDRDLHVQGPIVTVIRDTFEKFFEDDISQYIKYPVRPVVKGSVRGGAPEGFAERNEYDRKTKLVKEFFAESEEEVATRQELRKLADKQFARLETFSCPITTYVSDVPGKRDGRSKDEYREIHRNVRKVFMEKLPTIDRAVTISSPYFIANHSNRALYEDLLKRNVQLNVYTNSLRSSDSLLISANIYLHLKGWVKRGLSMHFSDSEWAEMSEDTFEVAKHSKWGVHAKTHIYEASDFSEVMIGSYNIDNRSDYYNTESALFCRGNDEFTQAIKKDVNKLMSMGLKVESSFKARDKKGNLINVSGVKKLSELGMLLLTFPSSLFDFLL